MTAPRYQNIEPEEIPETTTADGVQLRIVAGGYAGLEGPVRAVAAEPIYLDATLPAGAVFELPIPAGHNAFVHVFQGALAVAGEHESPKTTSPEIPTGALAVLGPGNGLRLKAGAEGGRALIVAGRPFNEPIVQYGPFVMNSQEQIVQAFRDYEMGRF
jgi:redox-sensitive bicupin YhaK (pirin superfamily)